MHSIIELYAGQTDNFFQVTIYTSCFEDIMSNTLNFIL